MGSFWDADERDRSDDLQPVSSYRLDTPRSIAQWHQRNDFVEIMEMLDKRLNDKGKNWRHVFKVCICLNSGTA